MDDRGYDTFWTAHHVEAKGTALNTNPRDASKRVKAFASGEISVL
jgi:hypothetical protein